MNVWVFVEGPADKLALEALWQNWRARLGQVGHGLHVIPLHDKSRFFRKIGYRAAEKLQGSREDIVVGLPDLYPNRPYQETAFEHRDMAELETVQARLVRRAIADVFGVRQSVTKGMLDRFLPSALKHDLEMLLLAAKDHLRHYLGTHERLSGLWYDPVEDQDQDRPPKRVVEELFRTKSARRRAYRDTKDASAVLRAVTDIRTMLFTEDGQAQCPVFKAVLDWIGQRTGIRAYA